MLAWLHAEVVTTMLTLSDEQQDVVRARDARLLVEAPAGTGKTETVAARVAALVAEGESPLLLTFTHASQHALRARLDEVHTYIPVRTVVSYARSLLAGVLDMEDWTIGDGADIASRVCAHTPVRPSSLLALAALVREDAPLPEDASPLAGSMLDAYRDAKLRAHYMDYGDVVTAATGLPHDRFSEVVVDEAQDLTPSHLRFIEALSSERLTLAGDASQSIFAFSGVNPANFEHLRAAGWSSLHLSHSYRVPSVILSTISPLLPFAMTAERAGGEVAVLPTAPAAEAQTVASHLRAGDAVLGMTRAEVQRVADAYAGLRCLLWESSEPQRDEVVFSTIHAAKGSGFSRVFVLGVGPAGLRDRHGDDAESLRRLMYVACTRARESLTLVTSADLPYGMTLPQEVYADV